MGKGRTRIGKVLFTKDQIEARLDELAREIQKRYADRELTVVAVLKGSLFFTADLVRRLEIPVRVDILEVASYFDGTVPSEDAVLSTYLASDVRGRHVLVVDDILDTGATLAGVLELVRREEPESLATCVFLRKKRKRKIDVPVEFCGFEVKAREFVVGYGLDYAQRYRNLPYLAVLEQARTRVARDGKKKKGARTKRTKSRRSTRKRSRSSSRKK